jgi:hypothetical protein
MATMKLHKKDLQVIGEILAQITEYKYEHLSPGKFKQFENEWLPKAIEQLRANEWTYNHKTKNTFAWIIDQILHCKSADGENLEDTVMGEAAIEICKECRWGQISYNNWARNINPIRAHIFGLYNVEESKIWH